MTVDERSRLQLADAAKRIFGDEVGITLMELLPPVGWADVATKQDLAHLELIMNARFDHLDERLAGMDRRMDGFDVRLDRLEAKVDDISREIRSLAWKLMTLMAAIVGIVVAAVRI